MLDLERLGYKVLIANSPHEAVGMAAASADEIDLLITDVVMPGMSGRQLAGQLLARFPRLKCLFMSGYTADVIAPHGIMTEDFQFIQKPFSMQGLATKVRAVLDER